jgi:tetratricopeptide (TPR) repeat protein
VRRFVATLLLFVLGCGASGPVADIRHAYEKGDFSEVVTLGRHAIRNGRAPADVHYYYGMALVALGRDSEGFAEIDTAVTANSGLKPDAAAKLRDYSAREGIGRNESARRLRKAHQLDATIDLEKRRFAVADTYYEDRDFQEAAQLYDEAVNKYPDAPECERAYARLSDCWRQLGDDEKARAAMETLVKRFPRSGEGQGAAANLNELLYQDAQKHLDAGEFDEAIAAAADVVSKADNRSLQQKARFLLGQAYEGKGDRQAAYNAYRDVIQSDRGDSGQVVERARSRIEALQEAGLK